MQPPNHRALVRLLRSPWPWLTFTIIAVTLGLAIRHATAPRISSAQSPAGATRAPGNTLAGAPVSSNAPSAAAPSAARPSTGAPGPSIATTTPPGAQLAASAPARPGGPTSVKVTVARNDTLDRIFRRLQVNLADLASLRNLPGLRQRLDRLHPGEALTITQHQGELLGLERRLSLEETLKVEKDAGQLHASVVRNPLEMRERTVAGVIDSSLFEAMTQAGAHDQTAMTLADIFAWDIDFVLDIQPGDSFTVTYEEVYENGHYLQDGPILAARFINQGREHLAVRYTAPGGRPAYYSPDGRSLRKAFLRAPL
ncbi:MAG TPA: hypothetical protein VMB05_15305, partial [Solirubrobacteraceae bacterium]|nr:hypothetical protein [Solirubrobacteraceae bacterium]